ncbi:MAG: hypothetical protein QM621_07670 [Aeromicrobium sp.]|uniref:DUF6801 domain-containing protein n=1 Tax=Aeromicrobium sp. TaxID=1871063 RepID=UPI0039E55DCB
MSDRLHLRLLLATALLGATVGLAASAAAAEEAEADSGDVAVEKSFAYVCDVNAPARMTKTIPVHVDATVPERVAPGSSVNVPFTLSMTIPSDIGDIAREAGYHYIVAYSDNFEVNQTHGEQSEAVLLDRVGAAQAVPDETGDFELSAATVNALFDIDESATEDALLGMPAADQIAHPRTDIGGYISFTFAVQMYEDEEAYQSGATPERLMLICTADAATDLALATIDVDEQGEVVADEEVANEELDVATVETSTTTAEEEVLADEQPFASTALGSGGGVASVDSALGSGGGVAQAPSPVSMSGKVADAPAETVAEAPEAAEASPRTVSFGTDASATDPREDDGGDRGLVLLLAAVLTVGTAAVVVQHRRALSRLTS